MQFQNCATPTSASIDLGKMDDFEQSTGVDVCTGEPIVFGEPGLDMDYYDGNTVTALWNYAQHFALDESGSRPSVKMPWER